MEDTLFNKEEEMENFEIFNDVETVVIEKEEKPKKKEKKEGESFFSEFDFEQLNKIFWENGIKNKEDLKDNRKVTQATQIILARLAKYIKRL